MSLSDSEQTDTTLVDNATDSEVILVDNRRQEVAETLISMPSVELTVEELKGLDPSMATLPQLPGNKWSMTSK